MITKKKYFNPKIAYVRQFYQDAEPRKVFIQKDLSGITEAKQKNAVDERHYIMRLVVLFNKRG